MPEAPFVVRKNAGEVIRIEAKRYEGTDLVDVRVWYEAADGEVKPTRKGLSLRPETWREVLPAVEAALSGDGPEQRSRG